MTPPKNTRSIEIESFKAKPTPSRPSIVLLRPVAGQPFSSDLRVEGAESLANDYPAGTRFRIQATLLDRPAGGKFLYTSWQWDVQVLSLPIEALPIAASKNPR